jgi:hypothetical protein
MMAFCYLEVYYLEGEHVLSEVVSVLEDDGVLLVAPHLVRQWIRVLPHLRKGNNFSKKISLNHYFLYGFKKPQNKENQSWITRASPET